MNFYNFKGKLNIVYGGHLKRKWTRIVGVQIGDRFFGYIKGGVSK